MAFEVVVLILTTYNAFSRPRSAGVQLTEILHRDGALFFLVRFLSLLLIEEPSKIL